jgi:RHS repeat-associated protein
VLTVFRDVLNGDAVSGYSVPVASIADYSPFGVQLDGRTQSAGDYRYGFQGQEKDDEVKGEGNSVNYKYRMHDPRVGRFFAVDPLAGEYAYNSPYAFSENRVINARELEGMEADDCFNFGKKRGFWGKMSSKVSFPSIELTFNKVVIEKISSTTSQNFGASGRNDRSMTKNVELKGSGNIRFNAYSFEDGLQITDENGNTVFNQNVIGGVVNVPVGAGNYQIGVTGHTDPNDPSGSVWDLSIQDNSVEVVKKTKFKFLGINLMSKVEKQTVDPGNAANNGPRTVKRKILGVTFNKSESARNISMRSPANVPGRTRRKEKEKQLPKPKRL